jgi:hypothetical protein
MGTGESTGERCEAGSPGSSSQLRISVAPSGRFFAGAFFAAVFVDAVFFAAVFVVDADFFDAGRIAAMFPPLVPGQPVRHPHEAPTYYAFTAEVGSATSV